MNGPSLFCHTPQSVLVNPTSLFFGVEIWIRIETK